MIVKGGLSLALLGSACLLAPSPAFAQVAAPAFAQAPAAKDGHPYAAIDRVVEDALRERLLAGAVVGIWEKGAPRLVRGYGFADLESTATMDANTVFRIGSITKPFTATALLMLAEQGKLSIDDPLSRFFPEFPRARDVTLRQLLNHTSGLHNYTALKDFERAERQDYSTAEMVAFIAGMPKPYDFEPGTGWNYSNSGYVLLGAVIEKVAGQPLDKFLQTRIFDRLELRDTAIDDTVQIVPRRARGYERSRTSPSGFENTSYTSMSVAGGAGAMRSTATDLLRWQEALFRGELLKPDTLAHMIEPARLKDGRLSSEGRAQRAPNARPLEYGLGIMITELEGRRAIGHTGSINGYNAWILRFPQHDVAFVVLTNTSAGALRIGPSLFKAFFDARPK